MKKLSVFLFCAIALLCSVCLFVACAAKESSENRNEDGSSTNTATSKVVQVIDGLYADWDFEESLSHSDLLASATYIGSSDAFMIEPINGGSDSAQLFTDYYFAVNKAYQGEVYESDTYSDDRPIVTVRIEGGEGNYLVVQNNNAPDLKEDADYLLFLYRILDGSDYNTEGNHYYLLGDSLGVWECSGDGGSFSNGSDSVDIKTLQNLDTSSFDGSLTPAEQLLETKDENLAELENLYRSGDISEEVFLEYQNIAEREKNEFARILSSEEQNEVESKIAEMSVSSGVS